MALINTIRKRSGILVGFIAGGLILFLIGGDLFRLQAVFSGKNRTEVGQVAGQSIKLQAYQTRLEQVRRELSGLPDMLVREQAWRQLIVQIALQKEVAALGLAVSAEELIDMVQGEHLHPTIQQSFLDPETKQFDKQQLISYLQSLPQRPIQEQAQWQAFEHHLATARSNTKFIQLFQQSSWVTGLEAQKQLQWGSPTLDIKYLYIPYFSCADDQVTVTEGMLQQYLKAHKKAYQVEESRSIQYLTFPIHPTTEDEQTFQKELQGLKQAFAQAHDALAFAKVNTDGPPTATSLQLTAQELPPVLAQQKTRLKKGRVIGPVQEGSLHKLYRVVSLPLQPGRPYKIAVIEKQLTAGDQAHDQSFRKADYCATTVRDAAQLAAYADQEGLSMHEAQVGPNASGVNSLPQARELVRWLYNDAKVGQLSSVFELGNNYVVAVMTERTPAGTAPLDQVRDEITLKMKNEQKASLIMAQLQQTSGATLEEKATEYGKEARVLACTKLRFDDDTLDSAGMARHAIGAAFALQPGAQAIVADDNGVLVVELIAKNAAAPSETEKESKKDLQLLAKTGQPYMLFDALKELAQVKDNRYRFY